MTKQKIEEDFEQYQINKKNWVESDKDIKGKNGRILIRPLLRGALYIQRKLKKQTIEVIGNKNYKLPNNRPVIFSVSHIGKFDFEMVNELINQQFYVMASDYRNMHGNFNGFMMNLFGCIYVNELSKEDRRNTSLTMKKILNSKAFGKPLNAMIFGEGTWNLSENKIVYDLSFGTVDIALSTNAVILPIGIEQYGKRFVVNFGKVFDPCEIAKNVVNVDYNKLDSKNENERLVKFNIEEIVNTELRNRLATLKYEIWEREGITKRDDLSLNYWSDYIDERISEWPGYSMQEQIDSVFHPKYELEFQILKDDLMKIKRNSNNEFLYVDDGKIIKYFDTYNKMPEIIQKIRQERNKR